MGDVAVAGAAHTHRVMVGTSPVSILFSGFTRHQLIVQNGTGTLYVKLGNTVALTDYTYRLASQAVLELPDWAGNITAIRASGSDWVMCTETI